MNPIVVQKYGGSSVKDLQAIRAVAQRVSDTVKSGHCVVVVVSAMGNTTNELLELARKVSPTPGRRELDMLVSVGERIAMTLLSMAVSELGHPARSFTGSQSGIITDEQHSNARVVAVRPTRILEALERGDVAIVAGFQGVSRDREVTTLGRGGSDTTAVALAAALNARWCEICSDVDGIYSADPRAVPDAIRLDTISLEEALSMARNGARVLHDEAVAYAHKSGIELLASATASNTPGTRIQVDPLPPRVAAIAADSNLERYQSSDTPSLLASLQETGAPIRLADSTQVIVDTRNWPDRPRLNLPESAECLGAIAMVAAVGSGVGSDLEVLEAGCRALNEAEFEVISFSTTPESVRWLVPIDQCEPAQQALHSALIST
ncbi:MAG: aspartate kinase [Myxococcota bacterium]|nr:aspartate kinase [Myxococcota bacterium]